MKTDTLLLLEDGTLYRGKGFGWKGQKAGEVVFNTALTGYEEIITDPSYYQQMVAMCYPHIGNYGINYKDAESYNVWISALIVREYSKIYSNLMAKISLGEYLKEKKVPGLEGIDTRALVRKIRDKGAMKALISPEGESLASLKKKLKDSPSITGRNLVKDVNNSKWSVYKKYKTGVSKNKPQVAVVDFGVKLNIVKRLEEAGLRPEVVSGDISFEELIKKNPAGVMLSNGPGDPEGVESGIRLAADLLEYNKKKRLPVLGICLGHQLICLGAGGRTYKLKFGHHGGNHPVKDLRTGKIEITTQNHNYCAELNSIPADFKATHINLNDKTVEGMKHQKYPIVSYQHHPEAGPGPNDSKYIFKEFREMLNA